MSDFSHACISEDFQLGWVDYPDSISHSINIFISGCDNGCIGCSNPELQDYTFGIRVSSRKLFIEVKFLALKNITNKVCLVGGDPLASKNIAFTRELLFFLKQDGFDVCLYTGHSYCTVKRLKIVGFKFLKTGRFVRELSCKSEKTDEYIQFASKNQRLYNENFRLLSHDGRYYFNKQM